MTLDRSHEPVAVNRVAFRHGAIELPWEAGRYISTVEVLIDDVELSVRLREVTRHGVVPFPRDAQSRRGSIPIALGNFVFDRRQYEEARRAFVSAAKGEG